MERLNTPAAIMNECDKHMTPLNDQVLTSLGATEKERTEIEPYLNDILLTFQGIAGKDFNSNFVALFLTNILFRALALLRMFPKASLIMLISLGGLPTLLSIVTLVSSRFKNRFFSHQDTRVGNLISH